MIKLYLQLFLEFFNIGVFSFGGGYATLPFLYHISDKYYWFSDSQLTDMVAVSSITPGPIGVNMATFSGFVSGGILGSVIATLAIMLPSFIFVSLVCKILDKFRTNSYVQAAVRALKPAGCALLSAVGLRLLFVSNLYLLGSLCLIVFLIIGFRRKFDPVFYLGISALYGLIIGHLNWIGV